MTSRPHLFFYPPSEQPSRSEHPRSTQNLARWPTAWWERGTSSSLVFYWRLLEQRTRRTTATPWHGVSKYGPTTTTGEQQQQNNWVVSPSMNFKITQCEDRTPTTLLRCEWKQIKNMHLSSFIPFRSVPSCTFPCFPALPCHFYFPHRCGVVDASFRSHKQRNNNCYIRRQ